MIQTSVHHSLCPRSLAVTLVQWRPVGFLCRQEERVFSQPAKTHSWAEYKPLLWGSSLPYSVPYPFLDRRFFFFSLFPIPWAVSSHLLLPTKGIRPLTIWPLVNSPSVDFHLSLAIWFDLSPNINTLCWLILLVFSFPAFIFFHYLFPAPFILRQLAAASCLLKRRQRNKYWPWKFGDSNIWQCEGHTHKLGLTSC